MEYIKSLYWIVLTLIFLIAEGLTAQLIAIWLVPGSICAAIAGAFGLGLVGQIAVFVGISVVLLACTRKLSKRLQPKIKLSSNKDYYINKIGLVTETVDNLNDSGRIRIENMEWNARSVQPDEIIACGETVQILQIRGVTLIVQSISKKKG